MENPSSSAKLERKSSIENDPKTSSEEELNSAREAALEVIKNNTKEEALKIFLKGLKPVGNAVKPNWDLTFDTDEECEE